MNITLGAGITLDDHALERLADMVAERLQRAPTTTTEWITAEEAARVLACSRKRIYELTSRGDIDSTKDGRRLLIRRSSLDSYLNR